MLEMQQKKRIKDFRLKIILSEDFIIFEKLNNRIEEFSKGVNYNSFIIRKRFKKWIQK